MAMRIKPNPPASDLANMAESMHNGRTSEEHEQLVLRSGSVSWPQGRQRTAGGSFGSVYRVKVHGFPCIAKRLHDVLREADKSRETGPSISDKFLDECKTLSTLRHPNIVQFIGIHRDGSEASDVSLIMEGLHIDLDQFLEKSVNVPPSLKLSFLLDVSNALVYLHVRSQPIIHRDVKAANVLLTRDMRAKLADLGTSKLLKFHPLTSTRYTKCPGTMGIMPPEALQAEPKYDIKLDVFSFGTLTIHTVNQEFPLPCEVSKPNRKGELQLTKRQQAIDKMSKHCLHDLVRQCLQDSPAKRPEMVKVRDTIERMSTQDPVNFTNFYVMHKEMEVLNKQLEAEKQWASKTEKVMRENVELRSQIKQTIEAKEMARSQAAVFKEDFETERRDREKAAGKYDDTLCRLQKEIASLTSQLHLEKARLEGELEKAKMREREYARHGQNPTKTLGTKYATMPGRRTLSDSSSSQRCRDDSSDLLQSLRFDSTAHSAQGYRCSSRYEWYQTSSDVVIDIMIPNVKEDKIIVQFTKTKVKVSVDSGDAPYNLSLHMSHDIVPEKCFMTLMKSKVELKVKKAEGIQWHTLDKRGTPTPTNDEYFQKWNSISEEDEDTF